MGCATQSKLIVKEEHNDLIPPKPISIIIPKFVVYDGMKCLTSEEYLKLGENMLEIDRYLKQNKTIINKHNELYKRGK